MGYTEEKNQRILKLQLEVNQATKDQAKAQSDATAKANTLTSRTTIYDQDAVDTSTSQANLKLADTAIATSESAKAVIEIADESIAQLYETVMDLVKNAHETANKAVAAAKSMSDLSAQIDKAKTKNKLISDLLTADAKKGSADASKAVTDAITALTDAMSAAGMAIKLYNSLEATSGQLDSVASELTDKKEGIHVSLADINTRNQKKTEHSLSEKEKAESASNEANNELTKQTARLTMAIAALAAANAAVSQ
ncbi:MAG: hypothetical protein QM534_00650 [Sediminibacterium sp.]|nr:hypothetical protein [Sediminibacterium sp.]